MEGITEGITEDTIDGMELVGKDERGERREQEVMSLEWVGLS
jgi:hypothetical protein